jgi:citronellol/citronellal dehydrogenase
MGFNSVFRADLLAGEVGIITGGGTGIGRCIAHELASLGATVVLSSRKLENLEATCAEIKEDGGSATAIACNVREEDSVRSLIREVIAEHGRIDFIVNNAGGQFACLPEAITTKGWNAVLETNLTGPFLMCREAHTAWMGANGGRIVNIVADFWNGMPMMMHTSAARAGVANLTKSLAVAWAANGIRINSVAPGIIRSSGLKNYPPPVIQMLKEMKREIPVRRLGTESEVSSAVAWLLSPGAAYVTGETVRVDGASSLYRQLFPTADHDRMAPYDGFHRTPDLPDDL